MNKKSFLTLLLCLWASLTLWAVDASYYSSYINNKSGSDLFTGVHNVAKVGYSSLTYGGLWTAYCAIDINSSGYVWDMYSNTTSYTCGGSAQGANYKKEGDSYNREHSIPKSWFGGSEDTNTPGTDLFHVVPTDGYVNNERASFAFGEVASASYTSNSGCKKGTPKSITIENSILNTTGSSTQGAPSASTVFEPMDEYKGDFARGYFGTMLKWANGDYQTFSTSPGSEIFNTAYTAEKYYGLTAYGVALLLKWHREDPVSQKEIDRNNGIQNQQGNRNPFIDYPILAEYIWGKYTGETFSLDNAIGSFSGDFIPGESDGDANGGGSSSTKYTITWSKDGNTDTTTEVKENARPTPPEAADCDDDRVFMGWTDASTYSGDGSDLLTVQSDFPQATADATYYAVYADKSTSGGGESNDFELYSGALIEGDYIIYYSEKAMNSTVSSNRLGYTAVTPSDNKITTTDAAIIWHIAPSGDYWTIYNASAAKYAAGTGTKNQAGLLESGTDDKSLWTASGTATYEFVNKANAAASVNANLRNNGTYGFACYSTGTGGALSLYKKAGGSTTYSNYSTECTTCEKVTITFDANGGEGTMDAQQVCPSTDATLKANTFTREHYTFAGWNTAANGSGTSFADKANVNINAALALFAQWDEEEQFTATFYANGSKHDEMTGYAGDAITDLTDPTPCEGYTFVGWLTFTLAEETTTNPSAAAITTIPDANTTYYAVYKRTETSGGGGSGEPVEKTVTFSEKGYENAADVTEVTMDNCTLTFAQSTGTNAPKYYTSGSAVRCYKNNTLTITSENNITAISITVVSGYAGTVSADVGSYASNAWSGSSKSVVLTHAPTDNAQWRMTAITVTTEGGGSTTTTYYSTSCSAACEVTITVQSPDDTMGTVGFGE